MIVLVQPMYSKQELNADSNYVVYTAWVRAVLRQRPEWLFLIPFPDRNSGFKYEHDGFFSNPRILRLAQRISPRKMANAVSYDGGWYDRVFREYGCNVVWCNLVEIAGPLRHAGTGAFSPDGKPVVVAAHNYVIHPTLPYPWPAMRSVALAQLVGALEAQANVVNSDHCRWMLLDNAQRYLSTEALAEIEGKLVKINYGTLEPDFPTRTAPPNDVPIIAYNHRLMGYKNYRDTFDVLSELWDEGLRFKLRYMSNTPDNVIRVKQLPYAEVKMCATRAEYLQALGECDLNVTNSQHETFCIAAIESMAFGQPLVAPRAITFPEITNARAFEYPFLFKTREEQMAHLRVLITDAALRRLWGERLSMYVREVYSWDLWAREYITLLERLDGEAQPNFSQDALGIIKANLERCSGGTLNKLFNAINRTKIDGRQPLSNQSLARPRLIRGVEQLGGRWAFIKQDLCAFAPGDTSWKKQR